MIKTLTSKSMRIGLVVQSVCKNGIYSDPKFGLKVVTYEPFGVKLMFHNVGDPHLLNGLMIKGNNIKTDFNRDIINFVNRIDENTLKAILSIISLESIIERNAELGKENLSTIRKKLGYDVLTLIASTAENKEVLTDDKLLNDYVRSVCADAIDNVLLGMSDEEVGEMIADSYNKFVKAMTMVQEK